MILNPAAFSARTADFPTRPRSLDEYVQILRAEVVHNRRQAFGCHLRRERRTLARSTEPATPRRCPTQGVSLSISDRNNRVIEGRMDMRDTVDYGLLDALLGPGR